MGREKVIAQIKKVSLTEVIAFAALAVICLPIALFVEEMSTFVRLIMFALTGVFAWASVHFCGVLKDPCKSGTYKTNPQIFDMADEHFASVVYEDKFVTISQRMVSCTKNPSQIAFLDEVFLLHISKSSMNFVPTGKELIISHARGAISLNVYGARKSTIEELFKRLISICPNTAAGYTQDNLRYLEHMRAQWRSSVAAAVQQNVQQNVQPNMQENLQANEQPNVSPNMQENVQAQASAADTKEEVR